MIIGISIAAAVAVIVIIGVVVVHYSSEKQQENRAKQKIADIIDEFDGVVYKNYTVDKKSDKDDIDLIFVGEAGLFCINAIIRSGKIYGDNMSKEWTQIKGRKEDKFKSPIKENEAFSNDLRSIMPKDYRIFSCVVFVDADIENVRCSNIITLDRLHDFIENRPKTLTKEQIGEIEEILERNRKSRVCLKTDL